MKRKLIHYQPDDGFVGDPMPLFCNGIYHVYFNKQFNVPRRGWGHISSSDLVHWEEHPDPFDEDTPGRPYNTGCVIYTNGLFHAFYAGYADESSERYQPILHSTSVDGIKFTWDGKIALDYPEDDRYYIKRIPGKSYAWRDPDVFYHEKDKCWYMVFCAQRSLSEGGIVGYSGAIGLARSEDLEGWTILPPIFENGSARTPECPNIFKIDDNRWGLLYFWRQTRIRVADSMNGPWNKTKVYSPDGFDFHAAKSLFDGKRRITFSMVKRTSCDCCKRTMTGRLSLPHELYFDDDSVPMSRFPAELDMVFSEKLDPVLIPRLGEWDIGEDFAVTDADKSVSIAAFARNLKTYRLEFDAKISSEIAELTVILHADEVVGRGYQLVFDSCEGKLSLQEHYEWDQRPDLASIPFYAEPGVPFHVDIVCDGDILELCLDNKRTLVARMNEYTEGNFGFIVQDGGATISGIRLSLMDKDQI